MHLIVDAQPVHPVFVDGFWMDETTVTNEQFDKFVKETGYVTVAERVSTAAEFPDAPPENRVAGSAVFTPPNHAVLLINYLQWWVYVPGANWRRPTGLKSTTRGRENYPVVQVAYADAAAWTAKSIRGATALLASLPFDRSPKMATGFMT